MQKKLNLAWFVWLSLIIALFVNGRGLTADEAEGLAFLAFILFCVGGVLGAINLMWLVARRKSSLRRTERKL
jgi:hypothetical protein